MILFQNFKTVKADFDSSAKLWESSVEKVLFLNTQNGWLNFHNSQLDGNPIANFYNREKKFSVRIIQLDEQFDNKNFHFHLDKFGDENHFHGKELVISSNLSEENLEKFEAIFSFWLNNPNSDEKELGRYFDEEFLAKTKLLKLFYYALIEIRFEAHEINTKIFKLSNLFHNLPSALKQKNPNYKKLLDEIIENSKSTDELNKWVSENLKI